MADLLLVRHGAFDGLGRMLTNERPGPGLNAAGRAQIQALAGRLTRRPVNAIYSSPLRRAVETAEILARVLSLPVQLDDDLREVDFGVWSGRAIEALADDPRWQAFNTARGVTAAPGGELMLQVQTRALLCLRRLTERHPRQPVLAVTHADVIRGVVSHCLMSSAEALTRLHVAPASITELRLSDAVPLVVRVNDVAHLEERGL